MTNDYPTFSRDLPTCNRQRYFWIGQGRHEFRCHIFPSSQVTSETVITIPPTTYGDDLFQKLGPEDCVHLLWLFGRWVLRGSSRSDWSNLLGLVAVGGYSCVGTPVSFALSFTGTHGTSTTTRDNHRDIRNVSNFTTMTWLYKTVTQFAIGMVNYC